MPGPGLVLLPEVCLQNLVGELSGAVVICGFYKLAFAGSPGMNGAAERDAILCTAIPFCEQVACKDGIPIAWLSFSRPKAFFGSFLRFFQKRTS